VAGFPVSPLAGRRAVVSNSTLAAAQQLDLAPLRLAAFTSKNSIAAPGLLQLRIAALILLLQDAAKVSCLQATQLMLPLTTAAQLQAAQHQLSKTYGGISISCLPQRAELVAAAHLQA
jgi:hypothetical protein